MDEKSISDRLNRLIPGAAEQDPSQAEDESVEQNAILVNSLKAIGGQFDKSLEEAVNEFLSGRGILLETTAAAITRGGDSGLGDMVAFLTSKFKLSPSIARLIASLLISLQSSTKKKPRRKKKPASSTGKPTSSAKKKPKKKTTASKPSAKKKPASKPKPDSAHKKTKKKTSAKPKKTTSKPAAKKKPNAKTGKKETAAKAKQKKSTKAEPVEIL